MANIGTFTAADNGYTGSIKTLTLNIKAKFVAAGDKDNDKALLKWSCSNGSATKHSDRCEGTFDWIGGTGKYVGLRGHSVFDGAVTAQGPLGSIGDANWKGEWELP